MFFVYLASIISGFSYGVTESINKNITEERYSTFAYAFWQHFLIFLIYLVPGIFFFRLPALGIAYFYLFLMIMITLIGNTLDIKAYKTEDISNITIVGMVNLVVAFLTGIILLSEVVTFYKILGIIAILVGIIVIFYEGKKLYITPGIICAFIAGVIWGFSGLVDKLGLSTINIITYTLLTQGPLAFFLILLPPVRKDAPKIWKKYSKKIILARLVVVVGLFLFYWSIQRGAVSVIKTNSNTFFLLSTVGIGIVFLRERKNIAKKLAGSLLCIAGIILLNFF